MMKEYSYFQADGLSLEALDTIKESKATLAQLKTKLCAKFGASDVMGGYREELGHFHFTAFHFNAQQKVPDGWKTLNQQRSQNGALQGTFALPAPNSPDAFDVASIGGLMERASRSDSLEGIFGVRFMREHPAGKFEEIFVRQSAMADGPEPKGKIWGTPMWGGSSPSAGKTWDPIVAQELDGKTYLRIPNKPGTEEPAVIPPDAIPVSYEKMLAADQAELERRRKPSPYDLCWGC
jgi:hypothetical protein